MVESKSYPFPAEPDSTFLKGISEAWHADGLEILSHKWTPERIQFTFRVHPTLAPTLVTSRTKGRLQHALRKAGTPVTFSRRVGFRTLGHNTSPIVLNYLAKQYARADLADPKYIEHLRAASWANPDFDPADPTPTSHGRYWYDLHLVLVTVNRFRIGRWIDPLALREATLEWGDALRNKSPASRSGHAIPG